MTGAALTSFYMFRLVFLTFFGAPRYDEHKVHVHESPRNMTVPLMILAFLSIFGGWFAAPKLVGGVDHFTKFLDPVFSSYALPAAEVAAEVPTEAAATPATELLPRPDGHANLLVNWVRAVESPEKSNTCRRPARIMERVMKVAIDAVEPGQRQCDAAAKIYQAETAGTPEFGGDYTAFVPMLPTGVGTSTPHLTWSDAKFVKGEPTILELGAARHRYHCPMARTVFLGKPPQKLADTASVVVDGIAAGLEAAKPGATCEDVEGAWRRTIAKHGIMKESRVGILDWPQLSPRLGRTHHEPPARRQVGAGAQYDVPLDRRHLDGRLGHRNQRVLPRSPRAGLYRSAKCREH